MAYRISLIMPVHCFLSSSYLEKNNKLCDGSKRSELSKDEDHILPNVDDFTGRTLSVLILHHGEASDGVQQPSAANQVD